MIYTKILSTIEEFEAIKHGDILIVEWHRDARKNGKRTRFASYDVVENLTDLGQTEIVLEKRDNVYFNYLLFCNPTLGASNAKSVMLVSQVADALT